MCVIGNGNSPTLKVGKFLNQNEQCSYIVIFKCLQLG